MVSVSCPRCGEQYGEQGTANGLCAKCGASLSGANQSDNDTAKDAATEQTSQQTKVLGTLVAHLNGSEASDAGNSFPAQGEGETIDFGESSQDLIRPRDLAPAYEQRVTAAWQATHAKFQRSEETIKAGAGATEQSFSLHIGTRKVLESSDDPNADYQLMEELGEGGMGKVWLARQTSLDRVVAIKYPKEELSETSASHSTINRNHRNDFIAEVIVTGQLDHPNIVPIYDLAHDLNGQPFYSMKRIEGRGWNKCMGEKSREENLEILMKACDAMRFAHDKGGVIHRDIKPENIVVGDFGEVSVMDFGIALRLDDLQTMQGEHTLRPCGTPAYMAPEMATANVAEIGTYTDVYLLGAVLYEIITGRPPHPSPEPTNNRSELISRIILIAARNEIVPADESGELVNIAYKAMATNIEDRYQTVKELQEAIHGYWSHLESITLTERGQDYLARAMGSGQVAAPQRARFDEYDRARFAFEEAIDLWPDNEPAREGSEKTILAYADYAYEKKAYAQGIALLDSENKSHEPKLRKLQTALEQQEAAEKHRRRLRAIIGGLVVTFLVCAVVASFFFYLQEKKANRLRVVAEKAKVVAENAQEKEKAAAELARQRQKEAEEAQEKEKAAAELARQRQIEAEEAQKAEKAAAELARQRQIEAEEAQKAEEVAKKDAVNRRKEAEQSSYVAEIGLAAEEVQRNAFETVGDILNRHKLDPESLKSKLRNWEWGHLAYLADLDDAATQTPFEQFPTAKASPVESVAISADQMWVVAGTAEGEIHLWRRGEPGQPSMHLSEIHGTRITAVAISGDSHYAASAGTDSQGYNGVKIWKLSSDKQQIDISLAGEIPMNHPGRLLSVAFSKDSADRKLLTSSAEGWVQVWALNHPEEPTLTLPKNDWAVWSAQFSPDEQRIVTAGQDGTVRVWCSNAASEEQRWVGHKGPVYAAEFSPAGKAIVSGGRDGRLLVWPVSGASCSGTFRQQRPEEVKQDLKKDQAGPIAEGYSAQQHEHTASIRSISFAGSGADGKQTRLFSASHDNTIRVWDISQGVENLSLIKTLRGHGGWVRSCAATTDGSGVLSGGYDGRVRLWNWEKYQFPSVLRDDPEGALGKLRLTSATYSADGKWIATASENGIVTVWGDMRQSEPEPQHLREGHQWLATTGLFFGDGRRLLTAGGDNTLRVWDANLGIQILQIGDQDDQNPIGGSGMRGIAAVSNHGRWIATGSDRPSEEDQAILAKLWNAKTGQLMLRIETPDQGQDTEKEPPEATALAFSPDDRVLFVGDQFGNCHLFETGSGARQMSFLRNSKISAAVFLPDGRCSLLTASLDGTVAKWDVGAGGSNSSPIFEFKHGDAVLAMAVSPDGKHLITAAGREDNQAVLRRWDLSTGNEAVGTAHNRVSLKEIAGALGVEESKPTNTRDPDLRPVIRSVAFHPQGKSALVTAFAPKTSRYHLGRWTWTRQKPYEPLKISSRPLHDIAMAMDTPDGEILTVGGSGARKWSLAGLDRLEKSFGTKSGIDFVRFSPDSQFLVAAGTDGAATIWRIDSKTGQWKPAQKLVGQHRGALRSAVFHPKRGDLMLTASDDGTARLWGTKAGEWQPILSLDGPQGHDGPVYQAIFSPDGDKVLTVGADNTARIWEYNLEAGLKNLYGVPLEHGGAEVHCGTISPDGRWIITGAGDDAWIWDAKPSQPDQPEALLLVGKLEGHSADVTAVAFSVDGKRVLTGSRDFTVKLWDTRGLMDEPAGPQENKPDEAGRFRVLLTLEEHTRQVTSVAFSPNGLDVLTAGLDGQAILWPAVPIPPSISLTDNTIDYTIGSDDKKPIAPDVVLNEPTPMDFTSARSTVELRDTNSTTSNDLLQLDNPEILAVWTVQSDLRASGVQTYSFTPRQKLAAGRQQFQALLRSISYTYQKPAKTELTARALTEPLSMKRTVTFELHGIRRHPDAEGKAEEIEPIREQVEIRLIPESNEVIPSATNKERDSGKHSVAMK